MNKAFPGIALASAALLLLVSQAPASPMVIDGEVDAYSFSDMDDGYTYIRHWKKSSESWFDIDSKTSIDAEAVTLPVLQGPSPAVVPEPSAMALMGLGLAGLAFFSRRRGK